MLTQDCCYCGGVILWHGICNVQSICSAKDHAVEVDPLSSQPNSVSPQAPMVATPPCTIWPVWALNRSSQNDVDMQVIARTLVGAQALAPREKPCMRVPPTVSFTTAEPSHLTADVRCVIAHSFLIGASSVGKLSLTAQSWQSPPRC